MMMKNIKQGCSSPEKTAGAHLSALISDSTGPALILFSGGSALAVADHIDPVHFGSRLTFGTVDERVTSDEEGRNLSQLLRRERVQVAIKKGVAVLNTEYQGESVEDFANKIDRALREWRETHPDGEIVAVLGVGGDGHTAGIFPDSDPDQFADRFESSRWVVGHEAGPDPHPHRVTVTVTFLRDEVDHSVVFVCGEGKRSALERVVAVDGDLSDTPARVIREMKESTLFTDLILQ